MNNEYDECGFECEEPKQVYPVGKWIDLNGSHIFFQSAYLYESGVTLIFLKKPVEEDNFLRLSKDTYEHVYLHQYGRNPEELPTPVFDTEINGLRACEGSVVVFNFEHSEHFFPGLKNAVSTDEAVPAELRSGNVMVTKIDLIYDETISRIESIHFKEPATSYKNFLIRKDFTLEYGGSGLRIEYEPIGNQKNGQKNPDSFFIVERFEAVNLKSIFAGDGEYFSDGQIVESIDKNDQHLDRDATYLVMTLSHPEKHRTLNFYLREHLESPVVHNAECITLHGFGHKDIPSEAELYKTTWIFNETKGINLRDVKKQYDICLFSATDSVETGGKTLFSICF